MSGKDEGGRMKDETSFYQGVIACLGVVELFGQDTLFREIVNTMDADKLLEVARRNGDLKWSGLSRYKRERREDERLLAEYAPKAGIP